MEITPTLSQILKSSIMFFGVCFELFFMETRTVKLLKALPNMSWKVMPIVIVATKYSKNKKDLGDLKIVLYHAA